MTNLSKKKIKPVVSKDAEELANALGLSKEIALEWQVRHDVTLEIINVFEKSHLNKTDFAEKSKTSRARITRILKNDTSDISLDVLLRVLGALGQKVQLRFLKAS